MHTHTRTEGMVLPDTFCHVDHIVGNFHSSCGMNSSRPPSVQVSVLSACPELSDIRLRVNEKRALNALNSDKNRQTIRWAGQGRGGHWQHPRGVPALNGLLLLQISNEWKDEDD